jgi:hypothetical protein
MKTPQMGRPPKAPEERRTNGLRIPLTDAEREMIESVAEADGVKPITWAHDALVKAAKAKIKASRG